MKTDEQIIEDFMRSRDPADWEVLVNRHFAKVHGLAFKMTSCQLKADDIAQDVFLKVAKSIHKFKAKSKFSTWLYRIAMNTIYSRLKADKKKTSYLGDVSASISDRQRTPDQIAVQSELVEEIEKRIQKLKPDFRAAIVLTAFQDLSPGEAAKVEGCTPQTFYWRLNQARTQLKKELSSFLESEK